MREAARIQTFPDEIKFKGSRENQCIQVGNAFPPMLAELIANNILKAESNGWFPGMVPKLAKYTLIDIDEQEAEPLLPSTEALHEEMQESHGEGEPVRRARRTI